MNEYKGGMATLIPFFFPFISHKNGYDDNFGTSFELFFNKRKRPLIITLRTMVGLGISLLLPFGIIIFLTSYRLGLDLLILSYSSFDAFFSVVFSR